MTVTATTQEKFEHWMIVELMGHNIIAGFVSEQTIGGAALIRVDVPKTDNAGPFTKFFNNSAIYAMTPTTEEVATVAANKLAVRPISAQSMTATACPIMINCRCRSFNIVRGRISGNTSRTKSA